MKKTLGLTRTGKCLSPIQHEKKAIPPDKVSTNDKNIPKEKIFGEVTEGRATLPPNAYLPIFVRQSLFPDRMGGNK